MKKTILLLIAVLFILNNSDAQTLPQVKMKTDLGEIVLEIDTVNAPLTAKNFLYHVQKGSFRNAAFYRVVRMDNQPNNEVKIEVIQGGIYGQANYEEIQAIRHESTKVTGLKHLNGTISMARAEVGTASTEFFICIGDQPELDFGGKRNPDGHGFAAFGRLIEGMDVVLNIQQGKDTNQSLLEPARIRSMAYVKQDVAK